MTKSMTKFKVPDLTPSSAISGYYTDYEETKYLKSLKSLKFKRSLE